MSSMKVTVHPLAISSICDHFTRVSCGGSLLPVNAPVVGILFGSTTGESVSIFDSSEVYYDVNELSVERIVALPSAKIEEKCSLMLQVYPQYKLLGWYHVNPTLSVDEQHLVAHNALLHNYNWGSVQTIREPLFLILGASSISSASGVKRLPMAIFKLNPTIHSQFFEELDFTLESSESERIALDQITKNITIKGISGVESQNIGMLTSLGILEEELDILIEVLSAMLNDNCSVDSNLLRSASKVVHQLPTLFSSSVSVAANNNLLSGNFNKDQVQDLSNSLLSLYLSAATKVTDDLKSHVDESSSITMIIDDNKSNSESLNLGGGVSRVVQNYHAGIASSKRNAPRLFSHHR